MLFGLNFLSFIFLARATDHYYILWFWIEISRLIFIGILRLRSSRAGIERVQYFLLQAGAGLILLILLIFQRHGVERFNLITLVLLVKTGVPPFHQWVLRLAIKISWFNLFILRVPIKVIPYIILQGFLGNLIFLGVFLRWAVGALGALKRQRLKFMFVFSSCFRAGLVIRVILYRNRWGYLFLIYGLFSFPGFVFRENSHRPSIIDIDTPNLRNLSKFSIFTFFLNIGGLPPLPGFYFKLEFFNLLVLKERFLLVFILALFSIGLMYAYVLAGLKGLSWGSGHRVKVGSEEISYRYLVIILRLRVLILLLCMGVII